jgi:formyl-CoA transferase
VYALRSRDGRRYTLHLSTSEKFYRNLVLAIGRADLLTDPRFATYAARMQHTTELAEVLGAAFGGEDGEHWDAVLGAADVPFGEVLSVGKAAAQEQVTVLNLFGDREQSGLRPLRGPWRIEGGRAPGDRPRRGTGRTPSQSSRRC